LAQDLFQVGADASPLSHFKMQESVVKMKAFIENEASIIYEAIFQFNGVLAALDILVKDEEGWKAYEVKILKVFCEVSINLKSIKIGNLKPSLGIY
jgi:hypothetical protein